MTPSHPDNELLKRIRVGDSEALGIILERYWTPLVRYCSSILQSTDTAEDVAQETFVRLWERHDAWRIRGSVRALLYTIARNLALDELRRLTARRRADREAPTPGLNNGPDEELANEELRTAIWSAVRDLPKRRREVFVLIRHHGLSYREAARVLDLAPQTVANHLAMAMADLREALAAYLNDAPNVGLHQGHQRILAAPRGMPYRMGEAA